VWPNTWFDTDGMSGLAPGQQCSSTDWNMPGPCMWFSNYTFTDGQVTLPDWLRTYQDIGGYDYSTHNPWRAPGSAPIYSPCGVNGGNPQGCPLGDPTERDCPGGGSSHGVRAEELSWENSLRTTWKRGAAEEVGWGIIANHGGGYSYRLCKEGQAITEECFRKTVLDFVGDFQWVQYGEGGERVEFLANRTREGTSPPGSQWSRNPIPACIEPDGGWFSPTAECSQGTQFPPPAPGLEGYGETYLAPGAPTFFWTLMDLVEVPMDLEPGQYVLSFRWDCEQTSQVWNACSSITVV